MKKVFLSIFTLIVVNANCQNYKVYLPLQNQSFTANSINKTGENTFEFSNSSVLTNEEPNVAAGTEYCGILNDIQYHPPQYVIQCLNDWRVVCFRLAIINKDDDKNDGKCLAKINDKVYLTNSAPEIVTGNNETKVNFSSFEEVPNFSAQNFDEIVPNIIGPQADPILGIYSNIIQMGSYYTVTCYPGPGYCIIFTKAPLNFDPKFGH